MGLCVIFHEATTKSFRGYAMIQMISALILIGLILWLTSCTKDPEAKKAELGPVASVEQVNKALTNAMEGRFPLETRVGDQALYEINQRIETNDVVKLKDILTEVKAREESEHFILYRLDEISLTYDGDQTSTLRKEIEWRIAKIQLPEMPSAGISPAPHFHRLLSLETSNADKAPPVTFHNLKIVSDIRPVPSAVAADSQCRNLNPCQLKVTEVSFDFVEWPTPNDWRTTQYRYIYSSDTPYPAHLILLCVKQLVDTASRDYFVSQCQVLKDFLAGPKTP